MLYNCLQGSGSQAPTKSFLGSPSKEDTGGPSQPPSSPKPGPSHLVTKAVESTKAKAADEGGKTSGPDSLPQDASTMVRQQEEKSKEEEEKEEQSHDGNQGQRGMDSKADSQHVSTAGAAAPEVVATKGINISQNQKTIEDESASYDVISSLDEQDKENSDTVRGCPEMTSLWVYLIRLTPPLPPITFRHFLADSPPPPSM